MIITTINIKTFYYIFIFLGAVAGFRYFGGFFLEYLKKQTIAAVDFDSRDESYR